MIRITLTSRPRQETVLFVAIFAALMMVLASFHDARAARAADVPDVQTRVVGGAAVPKGGYPFVASLRDKTEGSTVRTQHICGGTLIDKNSVLTAAHCVEGRSAAPLRITVGRTVLDGNLGQTRKVSRIAVHPRWDPLTVSYDAAVLKLSNPVRGIAPIKLATASQDFLETPGRNATVAGWGSTVQRSPGAEVTYSPAENRMREAQVPIVSDAGAEQIYDPIYGPSGYVPPIQVAAGETGKDACQGDSGGPMFAKVSGGFAQIGITSFGYGCGASGYPGVYAEVNNPSIRGFIASAAIR